MVAPHHAFHAVDRADHVRLVDHLAAAGAHKKVLRMVRHADHLVRNDLSRGNDQIIAFIHDQAVDLRGHGLLPETVRDLGKILSRDLADLHHVLPPVMHKENVFRNVPEHRIQFILRHGGVRSKRRQDIHLRASFRQRMIVHVRDKAGAGMKAGKVRRQDQDLF